MTQSLSKDIARVIRGILAEERVTTKDFAAHIGRSNSTVDRWLKGGTISTDALDDLAAGLGMSADELVRLALGKREAELRKGLTAAETADLDRAIADKRQHPEPTEPSRRRRGA